MTQIVRTKHIWPLQDYLSLGGGDPASDFNRIVVDKVTGHVVTAGGEVVYTRIV
jgi:hypothetical protein